MGGTVKSLDAVFDPKRNALNVLRLVLAALVIVSHAWIIGGYGYPPSIAGVDIGMFAVCGFFAISGYLITGSRLASAPSAGRATGTPFAGVSRPSQADLHTRSEDRPAVLSTRAQKARARLDQRVHPAVVSTGGKSARRLDQRGVPGLAPFLLRRFLRIYPAFLTVLIVTAVIFAPLSTLLGTTDTPAPSSSSAASYVFANLSLHITQWGIDGTLLTARTPTWNIPLWSLVFEALCYLGLGLLASVVPRRFFRISALTLFAALTLATLLTTDGGTAGFTDNLLALGSFFFGGVVLYLFRQRMPASAPLALIAAALVALILALGFFKPLAAFPLAYLLIYLGAVLPLARLAARNDISYGLYVYGFPVQQLLLLATIPFALASWFLVERPALRFKRFAAPSPSRHTPAPAFR